MQFTAQRRLNHPHTNADFLPFTPTKHLALEDFWTFATHPTSSALHL
jgi:hypothetical protein